MNYINYDKLKIQKCIKPLDLLINIFFINFSIFFFFLYMNIFKNLSAKYYQDNNERQQQKKS